MHRAPAAKREMQTEPLYEDKRCVQPGCTSARVINASIAIINSFILVASIVVIGTVEHVQHKLKNFPDGSNHSHSCILYSSCVGGSPEESCTFHYGTSHSCDFASWGFGIVAAVTLVFIVVSVIRAVLSYDVWVTVVIETVVLVITTLLAFCVSLTISIGLVITCNRVRDHYRPVKGDSCNQLVPDQSGTKYYTTINSSQAAAWFSFTFLLVTLVLFVIRTVLFCRQRRRGVGPGYYSPENERLLGQQSNEQLSASLTKPV